MLIKYAKKLSQRIALLRKIRVYLPLNQRKQFYNAVIPPVINYVSVIWTACDKECLSKVLKLQKRAARVILFADRQAPSVELFNKLHWLPFYEKCKISKCSLIYKRIHDSLPTYLSEQIIVNNQVHSRNTRYSNSNLVCPRYNRETEGGRTFTVTSAKLWNSLSLELRSKDSLQCFRKHMWTNIFDDQQSLHHFNV